MMLMCLLYGCGRQENVDDTEQSSSNETLPETGSEEGIYSPSEIEEDSWLVELSPSDKTLSELVTKIYSDSELEEIVKFEGTVTELNEQYPAECVRKDSGDDIYYRVSYLGDSSIAVINFDNDGSKVFGFVYDTLRSKSDFDDLVIGQSLEDVQKIDPKGVYLFLYAGKNDFPRISTHCTTEGELIKII